MRKLSSREAGAFNPRLFIGFTLSCIGGLLALISFAATPPSGTLSDTNPVLNYEAGPFTQSNPTPILLVDSGPRCNGNANPCDNYDLTLSLPAGYSTLHPNASLKVTASWTDTGSGQSDYDLYVFKGVVPTTSGSRSADYQSASGNNPEIASVAPLLDGSPQKYTIKIVPYQATREVVRVRIELIEGAGGGGGGGGSFGGADPTAPGKPRYQIFVPPVGSSAEASSGEFNIGFNLATGRIMTMNTGPIWRLTPPEIAAPPTRPTALPECCEALWQDRSAVSTNTGLDPILWTDRNTGRTFASNSTAGANAAYAYSDNDGDFWVPAGIAPASGADHQTIGTGNYPLALAALGTALNGGHFVLYCSQDLVGSLCQRSDDKGQIYGPAVPATGPGTNSPKGCGGLHGHVHIAPNGTAWLPDKSCGDKAGGGISLDAGTTPWTEFQVFGLNDVNGGAPFTSVPQSNGADPSVAIDTDSRAYYAYVNSEASGTEGHVHVAVSENNGTTWVRDVDIGAFHGIKNAAHVEAVGGSSGRAAVGFFGTNIAGDYQANSFPGKWYVFISTTYDGGRTWTTVNATPNDPVQSMSGIWQRGGSQQDRNTLDFNEVTVDAKGRVLYGYSDGCVTAGCIAGTSANDFTAHMRVARQTGGKTIFAANDGMTDTTVPLLPKPPCLSGTRSTSASLLSWKVPDNGGSDIVNYKIFRSNTAGAEVFIGQTGNASPTYRDLNLPADAHLFYRVLAINAVGESQLSNEIDLVAIVPPPVQSVCLVPGLTILSDKAGDTSAALGVVATPAPPGSDVLAVQLSQPYQADGIPRLIFTIKTDANPTSTEDPGWFAYVTMKIPGPDPAIANDPATIHYRGVRLAFKPTATFESYRPSPNNGGTVDGRFVAAGSPMPAEPSSNYDGPNGKITIVVKASDLTLKPGDSIVGFVAATAQTTDPVAAGAPAATALYDQAPDSLTFASAYTLPTVGTCSAPGFVSRLTHGATGEFDILLPTGSSVIEPRAGLPRGSYQLVYALGNIVTAPGTATVTGATVAGAPTVGPNANQISVPISGVTDIQHVSVTLNGVQDNTGATLNNLNGQMDVLLGDVNRDRTVNSADATVLRNVSGQTTAGSNFTADVNADGTINSADAAIVRARAGNTIAAPAGASEAGVSDVKSE